MPNQMSQDMRVALLYQASHLGTHLKDALNDLGAQVVYEAPPADIDRDRLEGSGAKVVIVNLDADSDSYIDQLYDVLDAGDYEVVFNDASVSSNLQGWDHARWARNLAAKILKRGDASPPRPPGAEAVPTPVQTSASFVPVAEKPGDSGPLLRPAAAARPAAVAAPKAPSLVEAPTLELPAIDAPTQELPTVELPRPDFAALSGSEPAGLDMNDLAEFARLAEPPPAAPEPAAPPPSSAGKGKVESDFAAELDALFASAADAPASTEFDIGLPDETTTKPLAKASDPFDIGSLDLGGIEDVQMGEPAVGDESLELHSEFPAIFDQLDDAAASVPTANDGGFKPAPLPEEPSATGKPRSSETVIPSEWNLEPDEQLADAIPTGPANFGIERMAPEEFLAPKVEESTARAPAAPAAGGLTLELMPIEEAIAPTYQNPNYSSEAWLDGSRPAQKLRVGTGTGVERVFVLGASIGGPEAVRDFLGALPAGFPMLFVLAQHMGEEFLELMSAQLAKAIALTVRNPTHGERVAHGDVLIVPTTHRVKLDGEGVVTMAHLPEKTQYTPSIDQVLRDVADAFGDKGGAIIFSGMAHDAIEGSQYLKSKGGTIWVQDPDTCVISSMVDGAREAGVVSFVGSPQQLAEKMIAEYGKA